MEAKLKCSVRECIDLHLDKMDMSQQARVLIYAEDILKVDARRTARIPKGWTLRRLGRPPLVGA